MPPPGPSISVDPAQIERDRVASLMDLVSLIRADTTADSAILYLVRSNTCCDGE